MSALEVKAEDVGEGDELGRDNDARRFSVSDDEKLIEVNLSTEVRLVVEGESLHDAMDVNARIWRFIEKRGADFAKETGIHSLVRAKHRLRFVGPFEFDEEVGE